MIVAVPVATVWTNPEAPRQLDQPALQHPLRIRDWLDSLSVPDRLQLCEDNLVQTQALYGTEVIPVEQRDNWVKILIPSQSTSKEAQGYPGWIPAAQLLDAPEFARLSAGSRAIVNVPTACLFDSQHQPVLEISFATVLPVAETGDVWTVVETPHGKRLLRTDQIRLTSALPGSVPNGQAIVEAGKQFLGLHYLWGGMSAYGYDCSGFAYSMHRSFGITIPRDAGDQSKQGTLIDLAQVQPGDLLFFAYEEGKGRVHHVGIYCGDGKMIHSPDSASKIEMIELAGYKLEKELCVARRYW
ncbi:NlpC/P60 family protein [Brevibacillus fulvus]|uniref:Cell wall-associated NlpC family hydrolase n=1 Tax=Brevibacillus fulvus TaxID=1125967 RepID=A0A938XX39_9BACL|nr:NlpC/P60 family protein [Brevibacillus fulvus]MBM7589258.1 cell wall-associated NlpC family hydrolase [Brevibacillus fulvus]